MNFHSIRNSYPDSRAKGEQRWSEERSAKSGESLSHTYPRAAVVHLATPKIAETKSIFKINILTNQMTLTRKKSCPALPIDASSTPNRNCDDVNRHQYFHSDPRQRNCPSSIRLIQTIDTGFD